MLPFLWTMSGPGEDTTSYVCALTLSANTDASTCMWLLRMSAIWRRSRHGQTWKTAQPPHHGILNTATGTLTLGTCGWQGSPPSETWINSFQKKSQYIPSGYVASSLQGSTCTTKFGAPEKAILYCLSLVNKYQSMESSVWCLVCNPVCRLSVDENSESGAETAGANSHTDRFTNEWKWHCCRKRGRNPGTSL